MINEKIKMYRMQNSMTQKDLAEKLFVTAQAVSRWENGEVEPSITTLKNMASIFNVRVDDLVGDENLEEDGTVTNNEVSVNHVYAVCSKCGKQITDPADMFKIVDSSEQVGGKTINVEKCYCGNCFEEFKEEVAENERQEAIAEQQRAEQAIIAEKEDRIRNARKCRIKSYIFGGLAFAFFLAIAISTKDYSILILGAISFTFISCLFLANNFIGSMTATIASWGFVRMPGVIFSLSIDGLIFLICVKLGLFLLSMVIALLTLILGVVLGSIMSVIVYPFALIKSFVKPQELEY